MFGVRQQVAGWSFAEALVVVAWFTLLRAVLEGAVSPSLTAVVEHVRKGTLDFVLLKPADAQFLVSTAKFEPWRIVDVGGALVVFVYAFPTLGHWPSIAQIATGLVFLALAVLILYSIWILVVSAAFWVVKVDNLSYLFGSLFDVGRWPIDVLRGVWRGTLLMVFTFVFPVALMTTYPALALLGRLDAKTAVLALGGRHRVRGHRPAGLAPRAGDVHVGEQLTGGARGYQLHGTLMKSGKPHVDVCAEHSRLPRQWGRSLCCRRLAPGTWRPCSAEATRMPMQFCCAEFAGRADGAEPRALRGRLVAIVAEIVARAETDDGVARRPGRSRGLAVSRSAGGVERAEQRRRAFVQRRARCSRDLRRHLARLAIRRTGRKQPAPVAHLDRAAAPSSRRRQGWTQASGLQVPGQHWREREHVVSASVQLAAHALERREARPALGHGPDEKRTAGLAARRRFDRRQRAARAGTTVDPIEVIDTRTGFDRRRSEPSRKKYRHAVSRARCCRSARTPWHVGTSGMAPHATSSLHSASSNWDTYASRSPGLAWPLLGPQPGTKDNGTDSNDTKNNEARIERLK